MSFDFTELAQADTAVLKVRHPKTGDETGFEITFAGPGHPQTIKLKTKSISRGLKRARLGDGIDDLSPEEFDTQNLDNIVSRIVSWSGFVWEGSDKPFEAEFAKELLSNPSFDWLRNACNRFLNGEANFISGLAKA